MAIIKTFSNYWSRLPASFGRGLVVAVVSCLFIPVVAWAQSDEIQFRMIAVPEASDAALLLDEKITGTSFEELARLYSIDPSSDVGGLFGPMPSANLRSEYRDALAGLGPGETSAAVPIDGAYLLFHRVLDAEERWMEQRNAGVVAFEQEAFAEAEEYFAAAVELAEELGTGDLRFARSLDDLAAFYRLVERHADSVVLFERVLAIQALELGLDHSLIGETLNNLAESYRMQQMFDLAEPFYLRALGNIQVSLGPEHPTVGIILNNLALLYQAQNDHARAQPMYLQSLAIMEQVLDSDDPTIVPTLVNLGRAYHAQSNYGEAGRTYRRALALLETVLETDDVAIRELRQAIGAASGRRPLPVNLNPALNLPLQ
jgi:tetratricopeptide (TPR) repeat protein